MFRVIIYPTELLLRDVWIDSKARITGWVVNGLWYYHESPDGYAYSYASASLRTRYMTRYLLKERRVVIINESGNYNDLIIKHRNAEDMTHLLYDHFPVKSVFEIN